MPAIFKMLMCANIWANQWQLLWIVDPQISHIGFTDIQKRLRMGGYRGSRKGRSFLDMKGRQIEV